MKIKLYLQRCKRFFDYIIARFSRKTFDQDKLVQARNAFWKAIDVAIKNPETLSYKLSELMEEKGYSLKQTNMLLFSLFFAGIDSTTQSLNYAIYECSKDVNLQNSVRDDLQKLEDWPLHEVASDVESIQHIILEGLRIFSPVIGVSRVARENITLVTTETDNKHIFHKIKKNELLFPSPNIMNRCPFLFPDEPDKFKPERWQEKKVSILSLPGLPFGGWKTICPGWLFYQKFMQIFLAEMLLKFTLKLHNTGEIKQTGSFINKLSENIIVSFYNHQ